MPSPKTRSQLKAYFVKNAIPTADNFADLIDAQLNQSDDGVFKQADQPLSLVAATGETRRTLQFYGAYPQENPDWLLCLNPRKPVGAGNVAGFGIADGAGNTKLTLAPDGSLTVTGNLSYSGRLSKLDVADNPEATVRAEVLNFGRRHMGRALLDDNDTLVLNAGPSWKAVRVDGPLQVKGDLLVQGGRLRNNTGLAIAQTDAGDWLRINPDSQFPAIAMYSNVSIGTGGLNVGDFAQAPAGQLRVTGTASIGGDLVVSGGRMKNKTGLAIVQTDAADWLRINPDSQFPAIALINNVSIGTGGLNVGDWAQVPQGQLRVTGVATALGGVQANGLGLGTQAHGATPFPYETLQLNPAHNLRIYFGTTQRFILQNSGQFQIFFDQGTWVFQNDGNLVKYRKNGTVLWALNNLTGVGGW